MRDHIKIVGILNMVLGGLGLLVALLVFVVFGGIAGVAGFANGGDDGLPPAGLLAVIGFFIAGVVVVISLPQLVGGWGLMHYKPWARVLMIVVSVIMLLHFPFGTALGVYGLWALLSDETKYLFASGGQAAAPYGPTYPVTPGAYPVPPVPGQYPGASFPASARPEVPEPAPGYPTQPPQ